MLNSCRLGSPTALNHTGCRVVAKRIKEKVSQPFSCLKLLNSIPSGRMFVSTQSSSACIQPRRAKGSELFL